MAEVQLSRAEAKQGSRLPPICMQCGAPATTEQTRKYSTDTTPLPPDPIIGGWLLFPLWLVIALLKLVCWSSARVTRVRTPLCHQHAHGWFTRSTLRATSIGDDTIVLGGVSDRFVQAWAQQRDTDRPRRREEVKVRCRGCGSLNEEAAKYCNQCSEML